MDTVYYYLPQLEAVRNFFELGGDVLLLVAAVTLVMWGLIFERLIYLKARHQSLADAACAAWNSRAERQSWHAHQIRTMLISSVATELERHTSLIRTCVALCPLIGLLGTVTGMIEVFEVMANSGSGNPRSMAAGVSKATVPTMAGMVAALSGVAMSAYLQRILGREKAALSQRLSLTT